MLLIAAAMEEELNLAMAFCRDQKKISCPGASFWQATCGGKTIGLLKTGVGPKRSAARLEHILEAAEISRILLIGYAGALDPDLKLGDLVAVRKALACGPDKDHPDLEHMQLDGTWELADSEGLAAAGESAGLSVCAGDALTSAYVIGDPAQKRLLYDKFHASVVDMETAALARAAIAKTIPFSCIRAVSDEAHDTFLAPISYNPSSSIPARAIKLIGAGNWMRIYREWKEHSSAAGKCLSRFLSHYLENRCQA
jgi:nucleoside phosphorylase